MIVKMILNELRNAVNCPQRIVLYVLRYIYPSFSFKFKLKLGFLFGICSPSLYFFSHEFKKDQKNHCRSELWRNIMKIVLSSLSRVRVKRCGFIGVSK